MGFYDSLVLVVARVAKKGGIGGSRGWRRACSLDVSN